ncbi:hypothetical protein KKF59_04050 [Patescibacteria group bacterium]|nr:hypothetical protein [Patescibacteria group bacterium]MBU1034778.1 hypothetical protein [Patescibacteria group bacterium]MBU1629963.1 hypothetical protein [Patescibacteria group bacterium]MBU1908266.1 hypothetical protein [Patescibacteria group bacterium]
MDKIFKAFGSLFFLVWSLVGLAILVGVFSLAMFFANGGAERMVKGAVSSFSEGAAGMMGDMAGSPAGFLGGDAQDCITKTLGEKRAQEIMGGSQPTASEINKLMGACGKYLPEGMMK